MKRINLILLVILLIIGNVSIYFWKDSKISDLNNQIIECGKLKIEKEDLAQKSKNLEADVEFYQNLIGESGGELMFTYSPKISDTKEWRDYKKNIAVSGLKSFELKYPQVFYMQELENGAEFYNINFGMPSDWQVFSIRYFSNENGKKEKEIEKSKTIAIEAGEEVNIAGFKAMRYVNEGSEAGPDYIFTTEPNGGYLFYIQTTADDEAHSVKLSSLISKILESLKVSK